MSLSEDLRKSPPVIDTHRAAQQERGRQAMVAEQYLAHFLSEERDACLKEIHKRFASGSVTGEWAVSLCARLHEIQRLHSTLTHDKRQMLTATRASLGE